MDTTMRGLWSGCVVAAGARLRGGRRRPRPRTFARVLLLLALAVAWDWEPHVWPNPGHIHAAGAQAPYPPSQWHPYQGGPNCIQVGDAQGNFNCSPLATINPATGILTLGGGAGVAVTTFLGPVSIVPAGTTIQNALGTDFILGSSPSTVATVGPGIAGATIRVRRSPIPGYCRLVVAFGSGFVEYPLTFVNPALPTFGNPASTPTALPQAYDYSIIDLPGGQIGC